MRSTSAGGGSSATKRWAKLPANEVRGVGGGGEDAESFDSLLHAGVGGARAIRWGRLRATTGAPMVWPSQRLGPGSWRLGVEEEGTGEVGLIDGPAGEDGGERGDVGLGVAAVDADGVELHDLAAVVLVEALVAALRAPACCHSVGLRVRADGEPVVEVDHHGRDWWRWP